MDRPIEILAQALLHSLWQIAVLSLLLWGALKLIRKEKAGLRYAAALAIAYCVPAVFLLTLIILNQTPILVNPQLVEVLSADAAALNSSWQKLPVGIWIIGAVFGLMRLMKDYAGTRYLVRQSSRQVPESVLQLFEALKLRANYKGNAQLKLIPDQFSVCMIGHLKPVIFFPVSALNGLSHQEIEAILAHELAHIIRHDYLHQILLSSIQSLFFYHPGFYYILDVVREERENACDDLALNLIEDKKHLATGLLRLGLIRGPTKLALTAISKETKSLSSRIKRLSQKDYLPNPNRPRPFKAFVTYMALIGFSSGLAGMGAISSAPLEKPIARVDIVKMKDDVCALLHADNIYGNRLYYLGGYAEITVKGDELFMNSNPLPRSTKQAIQQVLKQSPIQNADIVSLRFYGGNVTLKLAPHNENANSVYRVKNGHDQLFHALEKPAQLNS